MVLPIGVVQGRLVPQEGNFIQNFPRSSWRREVSLARMNFVHHIEWIVTEECNDDNPILGSEVDQVVTHGSSLRISAICLDSLNSDRFVDDDYLRDCLMNGCVGAIRNRVRQVVLPLLERSSIVDPDHERRVTDLLGEFHTLFPGTLISLETDLPHDRVASILERDPELSITFDTGNLTRLGYDLRQHLTSYGKRVSNLHIKDCHVGGSTVPLGTGDADLSIVADVLKTDTQFRLSMTLQAAREEGRDPVQQFQDNVKLVEDICRSHFQG